MPKPLPPAAPLSLAALAAIAQRWAPDTFCPTCGEYLCCDGQADVAALLADNARLRALLVDLAAPVEAFGAAMAGSALLAPELSALLARTLAQVRAAVGVTEPR